MISLYTGQWFAIIIHRAILGQIIYCFIYFITEQVHDKCFIVSKNVWMPPSLSWHFYGYCPNDNYQIRHWPLLPGGRELKTQRGWQQQLYPQPAKPTAG